MRRALRPFSPLGSVPAFLNEHEYESVPVCRLRFPRLRLRVFLFFSPEGLAPSGGDFSLSRLAPGPKETPRGG